MGIMTRLLNLQLDRTKISVPTKEETGILLPGNIFKYDWLKYNNENIAQISCIRQYISILPFDINTDGSIKDIFIGHEYNIISSDDDTNTNIILPLFETNVSVSNVERINQILANCFNIINPNIDDIYYIGNFNGNSLFNYYIPCYAVNITKYIKPKDSDFKINDYTVYSRLSINDINNIGAADPNLLASIFLLKNYYIY